MVRFGDQWLLFFAGISASAATNLFTAVGFSSLVGNMAICAWLMAGALLMWSSSLAIKARLLSQNDERRFKSEFAGFRGRFYVYFAVALWIMAAALTNTSLTKTSRQEQVSPTAVTIGATSTPKLSPSP
jgi:hypothetical protein